MEKGGAVTSGSSSQYALKTRAAGQTLSVPSQLVEKVQQMLGFFSCVWYNRIACSPFFSIQFTGEMFSEVIDRPQTVNDLTKFIFGQGCVPP